MTRSLRYFGLVVGLMVVYVLLSGTWASGQPVPPDEHTPSPPSTPEKLPGLDKAIDAFNKKQFEAATTFLEKAIENHPEYPPAEDIMADWFAQIGQMPNVRASFEKAVIKHPKDPQAYIFLGGFAKNEGRVTEADLLFTKAAELLKNFPNPKRKQGLEPRTVDGLAWAAEVRSDWPLAQKHLETFLMILEALPKPDPGKTEEVKIKAAAVGGALQRLAHAKFEQGDAVKCLTDLRTAKSTDPTNVLTPEATLALFYEQFGDHAHAVEWMGNALKAAPDDLKTRLAAAKWALTTGQIEDAKKQADEALKIDQSSMEAKVVRGIVSLFQKEFKAAQEDFENAHLQDPDDFAARNNLALSLCEQPDEAKKTKALAYAKENVQMNSKRSEAFSTLAWVLYRLGKVQDADRAIQQAISLSGGNLSNDSYFYLAQIGYDSDRKDQAKAILKAVLESTRPFSMKPEAQELAKKIKEEEKKPSK